MTENEKKKNSSIIDRAGVINTYILSASVFKAKVFIRNNDATVIPIQGAFVSLPDALGKSFTLHDAAGFVFNLDDRIKLKFDMDSNTAEFATKCIAIPRPGRPDYKFSIPEIITVYYEREFFRVNPALDKPVSAGCYIESLGFIDDIALKDICLGGVGLEFADSKIENLSIGMYIDAFDLCFHARDSYEIVIHTFCGVIRNIVGRRIGVEFRDTGSEDYKVLARYLMERESELMSKKRLEGIDIGQPGAPPPVQRKVEPVRPKPLPFGVPPETKSTQPEAKEKAAVAPAVVSKKKILIIEPSPIEQEKLRKMFVKNKLDVIQALDGLEGVNKASEENPDVILINMDVPILNGYECSRVLLSQDKTYKIPICILANESDKELVVKTVKLGVKDFVIKTMSMQLILDRVNKLVGF